MNRTESASSSKTLLTTKELTLIGLMTAVTCILAPISIPLPFSPVPVTFGNLAIYLSVFVLGTKKGLVSYIIYLLLGLVGLPVFSGFSGGLGKVVGPTGGYLVGFFFLIVITGFFIDRWPGKKLVIFLGMLLGAVICNLFGTVWLSRQLNITFTAGLGVGVLPYLPGDTVKIIAAAILGPILRKAVNRL